MPAEVKIRLVQLTNGPFDYYMLGIIRFGFDSIPAVLSSALFVPTSFSIFCKNPYATYFFTSFFRSQVLLTEKNQSTHRTTFQVKSQFSPLLLCLTNSSFEYKRTVLFRTPYSIYNNFTIVRTP